jgi:hypothetical protein
VEAAIDGRGDSLKERIIGVDVFDRPVGYNPATDHVVRSAACEVRRRLAQYYQDSSAAREIRVEIRPGSYVPRFAVVEAGEPQGQNRKIEAEVFGPQSTAALSSRGKPIRRRAVLAVIPASAAILASIVFAGRRTPNGFDSFWRPIMSAEGRVVVCVGAGLPARGASDSPAGGLSAAGGPRAAVAGNSARGVSATSGSGRSTGRFSFASTMSLVRLSSLLEKKGVRYRIVPSSTLTFGELQGAPSILIGAYNNPLSLRCLESLRFQFGGDGQTPAIYDRKDPQSVGWAIIRNTRDYALIARVRDKKSGRTAVVLGGIGAAGTAAAAEFLTDPAQLQQLETVAPSGWQDMNLQVVLSTDLVNGVASRPQIVATDFW